MKSIKRILASSLYPICEIYEKRRITEKVTILKSQFSAPFAEREVANRKRLVELLEHAQLNVPYYKDLFHQTGISANGISNDISTFTQIPYLTKEIVQKNGNNLFDKSQPTPKHMRRTGGSTGLSTAFWYDEEALDWSAAVNIEVLSWAGKKHGMSEVHLSTEFPEKQSFKDATREKIKCLALNRTNIKTLDFSNESLAGLWKKICSARPYLLEGHPSTMHAIARFINSEGISHNVPVKVFESTGESLSYRQRKDIEQYLGCQVFNRYGCAECGVIAHETEESRLNNLAKVVDPHVWVETSINSEGYEELLVTSLTNLAMPLIRYKIGDLGQIIRKEDGLYIQKLEGRVHDLVTIGDSVYPTHYLMDMLDHYVAYWGAVEDFQVKQLNGKRVELRLVVQTEQNKKNIREKIHSVWGDHVVLKFISAKDLVFSGERAKFRHLIPTTVSVS